jgi:death on curing protein
LESVKDIPESVADSVAMKAAHLIYCLIRNHPFLDGNKRTAFNIAYIFAKLNGFELAGITPEEALTILTAVAEGETSEARLLAWVKKHLRKIA